MGIKISCRALNAAVSLKKETRLRRNRKPYPLFVLLLALLLNGMGVCGQIITTVAGGATGHGGYWGEGGPATAAQIGLTYSIVVNTTGDIYNSSGDRILKINANTGIITTIAGTGIAGYSGDGTLATTAQLNTPVCISFDRTGNLYVYDSKNNRIRRIDRMTSIITTYAGNGTFDTTGDGGPATAAAIDGGDMAWDTAGNLYYTSAYKIRKISPSGIISTYVGTGKPGPIIDGVPVTATSMAPARGITFDSWGNMYLADSTMSIRKISVSTGIITRIAGTGDFVGSPYAGDGVAATTCHISPFDIAVDDSGNVYISDVANSRIEKVDTYGIIRTIAGTGTVGFSGDNGLAIAADISHPENVVLDRCNNVYIADFNNQRIRKVTYHASCDPSLNVPRMNLAKTISIYPNPTNNFLHIDNLKTPSTYRLLSIVGAVVQQGNLKEGNNSISVAGVPSGVYVMEVRGAESGERWVRRVLKE